MRILIINCISDHSETALYLGLVQRGIHVDLILDPNDPVSEQMQAANINVERWPINHRFDFEFDRRLRSKLNSQKFDCIYAPTSRGIGSTLRVVNDKTTKLVAYRGTMGNLSRFNPIDRLSQLNSKVDKIVCNCNAVKSYLLSQRVPEEKLPVVYKGHSSEWYQPAACIDRSQLGISPDSFVIGCIANVRPLKGVGYLIKAVQQLQGRVPIVCLVIGTLKGQSLLKYVHRNNLEQSVKFLGFRPDVTSLIGLCDLTVMPSTRREGFPRAIVESFSNNVPVICSNVGGMPEIVQDQVSGLVVPPGDVAALAQAIVYMYEHPDFRKQAGIQGRQDVDQKLAVDQYVTNMIAVFTS